VAYATRLSADAVPALLAVARDAHPETRRKIARELLGFWGDPEGGDFREWNVARARARALVAEARPELGIMVDPGAAPGGVR
jgi:hypothetical protein